MLLFSYGTFKCVLNHSNDFTLVLVCSGLVAFRVPNEQSSVNASTISISEHLTSPVILSAVNKLILISIN